jgi:acetyl-CoA C-acetyltransferase
MEPRKAVIVGGARIPFAKSFTKYVEDSNQDLMTFTLRSLVEKFDLGGKLLGEVALGAIMKHSSDWNLARECTLGSGLDPHTPAYDLQRACGTSLEAAGQLRNKIALGQIEAGIAGGTDTNSDLPIALNRRLAKSFLSSSQAKSLVDKLNSWTHLRLSDLKFQMPAVVEPRTGLSMGDHTEKMAKQWHISREEQDEIAFKSHQNGVAAYERGFYSDLIVPYRGITKDLILRADTSLEKLGKLKPAFDKTSTGTLTAGNSSPLTDGAAAVLIASEAFAQKNDLPQWATLKDYAVAAVDFVGGEGLLMAPTRAVSDLLNRHQLKLQDFDFYEIHEAFAAQVACTLKAWESPEFCSSKLGRSSALGKIDRAKLNVAGSSIALGHPFAATGARIVATAAKLVHESGKGRALISICTAGGMGVAAIVEK